MAEGGGGGGVQPHGAALRKAMLWLDERAREDPKLDKLTLVSEAAARFDLSPLEEDFLLSSWARPR